MREHSIIATDERENDEAQTAFWTSPFTRFAEFSVKGFFSYLTKLKYVLSFSRFLDLSMEALEPTEEAK